jgi:hypothetical protein|tara:strand:- start:2278 stop:2424 length:147 start_codon:yes stop_codon:yes gene_type:complete
MGAKAQYKHKVSFKIGNFSFCSFSLSGWWLGKNNRKKSKTTKEEKKKE